MSVFCYYTKDVTLNPFIWAKKKKKASNPFIKKNVTLNPTYIRIVSD